MSEITGNLPEGWDTDVDQSFAVGEEAEQLRRGGGDWGDGQVVEIDREGYGKSLYELPLYDVVREIEEKWDPMKYHMVIDAMLTADSENELEAMHELSDNQLLMDKIPEGPGGGITWYCEFGGHKRIFDTLAAARHWFLNEITVTEKE